MAPEGALKLEFEIVELIVEVGGGREPITYFGLALELVLKLEVELTVLIVEVGGGGAE